MLLALCNYLILFLHSTPTCLEAFATDPGCLRREKAQHCAGGIFQYGVHLQKCLTQAFLFDVQELLMAKRKATAEIERLQERLDPKWLSSAFLNSARALAKHTCELKKLRLVLCRGTAAF